jgi:uncharacterized SAM-binding protein YcdF (DUF218 family)
VSAPSFASADPAYADGRTRSLAVPRTIKGAGTAAVTIVVVLALLLPVGAVLQIVLTGQLDDRTPTQAIVVLDPGNLWGDPGPVRSARVAHAVDLYLSGVAPVVVLAGPDRATSQARDALLGAGVPDQDVIAFHSGGDTVGSLQVVAGVMRDLGWSAATVVTDPAQAARSEATAASLGIDAHLSPTDSGAGSVLTSESVARETIALLRHYLVTRWTLPRIVG